MESNDFTELMKRAEDLSRRCRKSGRVTATGFLTPAEQQYLRQRFTSADCSLLLFGGRADCERAAAFFLPDYMDRAEFEPEEYIRVIRLTAHFGEPGHRDYMGAILAMGVGREWVGDISVSGPVAHVFCLPSVSRHLLSIDKVGRCGVTAEEIALGEAPAPERQVKSKSFSVMSPRLDAVLAGMFDLSRTEAAKQISAGGVSLNYVQCLKTDAPVQPGDTVSLRGRGKGVVTGTGGLSKKGRLFIYAEVYV